MKNKIEDFSINIFIILLLLIIEIIIITSLFNIKISTYKVFNGLIYKDNCMQVLVNKKELKIINSNKKLFHNNKSYIYKIIKIDRNIINNSSLVYLKCKIKGTINDVISFSINNKKIRLLEMFKIIWKE